MPRCNIGDAPLNELLDRYGGRINAHVAETAGGRFDIALTVEGLEIGCLRLRGSGPVLLYQTASGDPAAVSRNGDFVSLPL